MMMYVQDYDETYPCYRPTLERDWGAGPWGPGGEPAQHFHSTSLWIPQLLPYVKNPRLFFCPRDAIADRNHTGVVIPGSGTPFPVSYGPNRLFVTPSAYGGPKGPVTTASVHEPQEKYLLADCITAHGFDLATIAYIRYPNYDPAEQQNGWTLDQFTALGRVAWPDEKVAGLPRHDQGNNVVFADSHVRWLRHNQIPNNDRRHGKQYKALVRAVVPWQPGHKSRPPQPHVVYPRGE